MPPRSSTRWASRTRRKVVSAHRTPHRLYDYANGAADRGLKVIVAGAGGAAHLPGMAAAMTHLPVLGVPVESKALKGMDSLLSIVQMPGGVPVGTLAIGKAGAINAGLLAAAILATSDPELEARLIAWRAAQTEGVAEEPSVATVRSTYRSTDFVFRRPRPLIRQRAFDEAQERNGGERDHDPAPAPRIDDRHPRIGPARPDARDRRGAARLSHPHLRARNRAGERRLAAADPRALSTMPARSPRSRARSMSSPTSSRTSPSRRSRRSARSCRCVRRRCSLATAQDRVNEKSFVEGSGGRPAPWREVEDRRRTRDRDRRDRLPGDPEDRALRL